MEKEIIEFPAAWMAAIFMAMPRLLAIFSILPMFSRQALPGLLRVGVAFSVAIFIVPSLVGESIDSSFSAVYTIAIIIKEVMIGFILGFLIALPLWAFDIMGAYVDNQRGASIASTINPLTGHDTSPLGELFSQAAVTFLLISGGYLLILNVIYDSFSLWPVYKLLPKLSADTPIILLSQMDRLMSMAVLFSAPIIFAMFLAEFGLGLVSRFVPQLQVFFMAMPIKSALAMFMFSIYTVALFGYAGDEFEPIGKTAIHILSTIFN
jgi:type III secretion protein T